MTDKQSYEDQIFEALCDCVGPNPDDIYDRTIAIGKQADITLAELKRQLAEKDARIKELEKQARKLKSRAKVAEDELNDTFPHSSNSQWSV